MTNGSPPHTACVSTIAVRLTTEAGQLQEAQRLEIVLHSLAAALTSLCDSAAPAWTVRAVCPSDPFSYAITALPGTCLSHTTVWALALALRDQPYIAAADPAS